jgi:aminoglycoside phosphotransferase (APT) family kinase protein
MGRSAESIATALRTYLLAGHRMTNVTQLSSGHSNETYLLDGLGMVLRMPPAGVPLLDGLDMAAQFRLYAVLGREPGAPPVPRVIHFCDDSSILGAPFYLVECVEGSPFSDYAVPDWVAHADQSFRDRLSRQYVHSIASLAKLNPLDALGPLVAPVLECQRWRRFAERAQHERLVHTIHRLTKNEPPRSGVPTPVHGDPKMSNMLWRDGSLQSVVDWELAFNGDPLADLGYVLLFFANDLHPAGIGFDLPGMWSRAQVITEWERVSDRSARGVEWYECAAIAKVTAIIAYGHHLAATHQVDDTRFLDWAPNIEAWTGVLDRSIDALEL